MPTLLVLGLLALVLWKKKGHGGLQHLLHSGRPPGMPPERYWPAPPLGPGSLTAPPWPTGCASNDWQLPAQRDIPQEVTDRAVEILRSPAQLGTQIVERVAGRVWRFQVEIHGANELNPNPHRGVGVRLCL
jgi:hypothetical protein